MHLNQREEQIGQYLQKNAQVLCLDLLPDGTVSTANAFAEQFVGRPLVGVHFREFVIDFKKTINPFELAKNPQGIHLVNVTTYTGLPQTLRCMFSPTDEGVLMLGGVDVAEQETLRKQIVGLNQQLGNLARDLQKGNAELLRLNDVKNQFLGMATHDLRQPVGLIMTYSEFLMDEASESLNEEQRGFLQQVFEASVFMRRLIDDFLDVAVIESGHFELRQTLHTLPALIERVSALAQIQARKKKVELRIAQARDLPPVHMDEQKMGQVLANLLANAIEYSSEGGTVHVLTRDEGDKVEIVVRDSGVGMSEEELKRLFTPYLKARRKKTGGEKSTGLGLVIARKITEAHGGKIFVESTLGKGSVFRVLLPKGKPEKTKK